MKPLDNKEHTIELQAGIYKDYDLEYLVEQWSKNNQSLYYGEMPMSLCTTPFLHVNTLLYFPAILEILKLIIRNDVSGANLTYEELNKGVLRCTTKENRLLYTPYKYPFDFGLGAVVFPLMRDIIDGNEIKKFMTFHTVPQFQGNIEDWESQPKEFNIAKAYYGRMKKYHIDMSSTGGNTRLLVFHLLYDDEQYIKKSFLFDAVSGEYDRYIGHNLNGHMKKLTESEILDVLKKNEYGIHRPGNLGENTLLPTIYINREEYNSIREDLDYGLLSSLENAVYDNSGKLHIENLDEVLDALDEMIPHISHRQSGDVLLKNFSESVDSFVANPCAELRDKIDFPLTASPDFNVWAYKKNDFPVLQNYRVHLNNVIEEIYSYIGISNPKKAKYIAKINCSSPDKATLLRSILAIFLLFVVDREHHNKNFSIKQVQDNTI